MSIQTIPARDTYFSSYPKALHNVLDLLVSEPDALQLLNEVKQGQGKIDLELGNSTLWDWNRKKIVLNRSLLSSRENLIAYLLFELNNASFTENYIRTRETSQDVHQFVRSFEVFEHRSALKTQKMVRKILGEHSESDFKWIYPHFDFHYAVQQIEGHSERIAARYFPQIVYKGTLKYPLQELNKEERNYLYTLFYHDARENRAQFDRFYSILKDQSVKSGSCQKALECAESIFCH